MHLSITAGVVAVLFLATVIRSALGFGEALVAVPLLALAIPVGVAAPVAVLASITVAFVVVLQDWRSIHLRSAVWLVIPTLIGIPLGLMLLRMVPESAMKAALGIIIMSFSAWSLVSRTPFHLHNDRAAGFFGFVAGVMGGAYGMNGPPLAIYGSLRRWSPASFRATLQGYFLPASIAVMAGYAFGGLWTPVVTRFYLFSLPGVVVAIFIGRVINRKMDARLFPRYVHAGLIGIGAILLIQSL
ncbi:MAG TPA: sulfite exporter TauE/SafE family protein [Bryobacteraceae bacterium]|nr:sulfite exporter TauE/SafE family protein [Bryobacteraceae bacterium]